jgi:glutamine synthetase
MTTWTDGLGSAVRSRSTAEWLAASGTRAVLAVLVDAGGTLRAKRLSPAAAARAFEDGWSFIDAIEWWTPDDKVGRAGAARSHVAHLELDSGRAGASGSTTAVFFAEFGDPLRELSARFQLARLAERAENSGIVARAGWEFECIVLEETEPIPVPAMRDNRCWSALTMATEEDDLAALVGTLEAGGIPVDHVCAELGPGCLEIALAPDEVRNAADHAALAKLYARAHYARRQRHATFMAQLGPNFPGLGGHPSLSLHSALDGRPLLSDDKGVLSKTGAAAVAGIVTLLPELMALVAPYPNSYRRFGAGNWAPSTATWGVDNYSCAVRVVVGDPQSARLELRIPGADVSPHHCLAMMLGAALYGIEERLEPPAPAVPPSDGRLDTAAAPLPHDLVSAADRLAGSPAARTLFGHAFVDHFAASRRDEAAACHRFVSAEERARYLAQV